MTPPHSPRTCNTCQRPMSRMPPALRNPGTRMQRTATTCDTCHKRGIRAALTAAGLTTRGTSFAEPRTDTGKTRPCARCLNPMSPTKKAADRPPGVRRSSGTICQQCGQQNRRDAHTASGLTTKGTERAPYRSTPRATLPDDGIIDDIAVQRAAEGDRKVRLSLPELHAAITHLHSRQHSINFIAAQLDIGPALIENFLAGRTLPAARRPEAA